MLGHPSARPATVPPPAATRPARLPRHRRISRRRYGVCRVPSSGRSPTIARPAAPRTGPSAPSRRSTSAHALVEPAAVATDGGDGDIDLNYLERIGCADRLETWREICDAFPAEVVSR